MYEVCKVCGGTCDVKMVGLTAEVNSDLIIIPDGLEVPRMCMCGRCRAEVSCAIEFCLVEINKKAVAGQANDMNAEAAQDLEIASQSYGINPTWHDGELPICGQAACRFYQGVGDGLCLAGGTGVENGGLCEPAIQRMARALRPFAEFAEAMSASTSTPEHDEFLIKCIQGRNERITSGHLRAAAESLPKGVA